MWRHSKHGNFSVRSCYHMILAAKLSEDSTLNGSNSGERRLNWKGLWSLHLPPPKVKVFLWRACFDIIPVGDELVRRHIAHNPYCIFCETQAKTSEHIFFECEVFGSIWSSPPFNLEIKCDTSTFAARFQFLWANLEQHAFELACVVCWKCWEFRNHYSHGDDTYIHADILKWSIDFLDNFRTATSTPYQLSQLDLASKWHPPSVGRIKINFDAAMFGSTHFQVVAVARNEVGECLGWSVRRFIGCPSDSWGSSSGGSCSLLCTCTWVVFH